MKQLKPSQKELYRLINKQILLSPIELNQFWSSDRICVTLQDFIDMMTRIGIIIGAQNMRKFQQQIELISLENVIENVNYWKNRQEDIGTYLSKKSPKKPETYIDPDYSPSISSHSKISSNQNYNSILNRKFLSQHAKKQFRDKMKLNQTLRNVKNQSDYELLLKIGQINDICAKLKNGTIYAVQTRENGKVQIMLSQKGKKEKKISQREFQTQYEDLKLLIMNQVEQTEGTLEEDLKKVLVEVMCLSSDMKKQIKLLQSKGISH